MRDKTVCEGWEGVMDGRVCDGWEGVRGMGGI